MKYRLLLVFVLFTFLVSVTAITLNVHSEEKMKMGEKVTKVFRVIDYVCFIGHGRKGKEHVKCAKFCNKGGVPYTLLDEKTNKIYYPLVSPGEDPDKQIEKYPEQLVEVTGMVVNRAGQLGIMIKKVKPLNKY